MLVFWICIGLLFPILLHHPIREIAMRQSSQEQSTGGLIVPCSVGIRQGRAHEMPLFRNDECDSSERTPNRNINIPASESCRFILEERPSSSASREYVPSKVDRLQMDCKSKCKDILESIVENFRRLQACSLRKAGIHYISSIENSECVGDRRSTERSLLPVPIRVSLYFPAFETKSIVRKSHIKHFQTLFSYVNKLQ